MRESYVRIGDCCIYTDMFLEAVYKVALGRGDSGYICFVVIVVELMSSLLC